MELIEESDNAIGVVVRSKSGISSETSSVISRQDAVALEAMDEARMQRDAFEGDPILTRNIPTSFKSSPDLGVTILGQDGENGQWVKKVIPEEEVEDANDTWVCVGQVVAVIGFHKKDGIRYWYVGRVVEVNKQEGEAKLWWMKNVGGDQYQQVQEEECWWESVDSLVQIPQSFVNGWNPDKPLFIDSAFLKSVPLGGDAACEEKKLAAGGGQIQQRREKAGVGRKRSLGKSVAVAGRNKPGPAYSPSKRAKKVVEVRGKNPAVTAIRNKGVLVRVKTTNGRTLDVGQAVYVNNADDKAKPYIAVIEGFGFALPDAMLLPPEQGGVAARALEDGDDSATQVSKCLKLLRGSETLSEIQAEMNGFHVDPKTGNELYLDMDVYVVLRWLYQARDLPEGVLPAYFTPGMREIFSSDHLDINPLDSVIMGLGRSLHVLELKEYCQKLQRNDGSEGANFWYRMSYLSRLGKLDPSPSKFIPQCLCRQPHDPDMSCIKCLSCGAWYHFACIGHSADTLPTSTEPGVYVPAQVCGTKTRLKGRKYKCIRCLANLSSARGMATDITADVGRKHRNSVAERRRDEERRVKHVIATLRPLDKGLRKVVNFSLFLCEHGINPNDHKSVSSTVTYLGLKYIAGALRNAAIGPTAFPGWTLRFYVDDSVEIPQYAEAMSTLSRLPHCEVVKFHEPSARHPTSTGHMNLFGTLSRFYGLDDPDAAVCICRDVDNLLTTADFDMVEKWLSETQSACQLHRIFDRDYSWPILGGGVGARLPLPFSVTKLVDEFIKEELVRDPDELGNVPNFTKQRFGYFVDQRFLRDKILPAMETYNIHCKTDLVSIESAFMEGRHAMHSKNTVYWNTLRYTDLMPHATRSTLPKTKLVPKFLAERIQAALIACGLAPKKKGERTERKKGLCLESTKPFPDTSPIGKNSWTDTWTNIEGHARNSGEDYTSAMPSLTRLANPAGSMVESLIADNGAGIGAFDNDSDTYEGLTPSDGDLSPGDGGLSPDDGDLIPNHGDLSRSDGGLSPLPSPAIAPRVR